MGTTASDLGKRSTADNGRLGHMQLAQAAPPRSAEADPADSPWTSAGRSTQPDTRGKLRQFWIGQTDLAPLGLFRILYGILLVFWLCQLFPNLAAFYTDKGVLPRSEQVATFGNTFTLLASFGQYWEVAVFWAAGLTVALMLLVGLRTRTASILAFLVVSSFEWRNPLVSDGSDFVFRVLPFWLIFTAAGNRWSVDALLRTRRGEASPRTGWALPVRILEMQVAWIYLATGLEKLAGTDWLNGTAVYYALQLSHNFARPFALPLAFNSPLVHAATWGALGLEMAFLPLVFISRWTRVAAAVLALCLHLGILIFMNVGDFPLIMIAALALFMPSAWVESWMGLVTALAERLPLKRLLSAAEPRPAVPMTVGQPDRPAASLYSGALDEESAGLRHRPWPASAWTRLLTGALLIFVMFGAFDTGLPPILTKHPPLAATDGVFNFADLYQKWDMFAPNPMRVDWWYLAPATLSNGATYDLFTGGPVSNTPRYANPFDLHWEKLNDRVGSPPYANYLLEYARSFCRLHNDNLSPGQPRLVSFDLYVVSRTIQAPGKGAPITATTHLWQHHC